MVATAPIQLPVLAITDLMRERESKKPIRPFVRFRPVPLFVPSRHQSALFLFLPFLRPRSHSLYVRFFWWSTPVTTPRSGAVASRYASYPSPPPLAPIPDQLIPPPSWDNSPHSRSAFSQIGFLPMLNAVFITFFNRHKAFKLSRPGKYFINNAFANILLCILG